MSNTSNIESEIRVLDSDLNRLGSADFIRSMHEPDSTAKLTNVLNYLLENWPTSEDTQKLRKHIHEIHGVIRGDESETMKKLIAISGSNIISEYKSGNQTPKDKAVLFINLYSHRPAGIRLYELYKQVDEVGLIAQAIFKIRLRA